MVKKFYLKADAVLKEKIFFLQYCLSNSFLINFFEILIRNSLPYQQISNSSMQYKSVAFHGHGVIPGGM